MLANTKHTMVCSQHNYAQLENGTFTAVNSSASLDITYDQKQHTGPNMADIYKCYQPITNFFFVAFLMSYIRTFYCMCCILA
jgi:hypothetical protein